jgi:plastocyanin
MSKTATLISCLCLLYSCGGDSNTAPGPTTENGGNAAPKASTPEPGKTTQARKTSGGTWNPAMGTATVTGTVRFDGKPPRRRPVQMGAEPACAEHHKTPPVSETVIVNADGTLRNVFVVIKKGLQGWKFPVPSEPVVLDQVGCTYVPHVFGVRTGQTVNIRNSDGVEHNVHLFSKRNGRLNFAQTKGASRDHVFKRQEVMVQLKCDIHGWMKSWAGVVKHPFFAVTADGGTFELKGLPPGDYEVEAWHEKYGSQTGKVTVGDNETKTVDFTFSKKKRS